MDANQVDQLLMIYSSKLPIECIGIIREKLLYMDYSVASIKLSQLKDPTLALVLSAVLGMLGIDRFYIGHPGLGIGKLFTCGGLYVWWIIDIFLISDATKRKNLEILIT